jgi:arylsulfatase A-like enzyme/Flp pilus assembly protein TadD
MPRPRPSEATASGLTRAVPIVAAVLAIGIGVAVVMARRGPAASPVATRYNLLLVTLDTTRADHLGAYGYAKARTPFLDRLAAEGARFEAAFTPIPITLASHASIFTGLYPPVHGVRNNGFRLEPGFATLASVLEQRGYRTGAFVSAFVLDRRYGLSRGFGTYDDVMQGSQAEVLSVDAERRGDFTAAALTRWLEGQAAAPSGPLFAWLHLYDPHDPYRPPAPFDATFVDAPYDGEIAFADSVLAGLFETLGRLGLKDHTLIAVVGDHGEGLGEHGEDTHGVFLYDATLRVPMILWRPGVVPAGLSVTAPVRTIDLAPTLLALLGAPPLPRAQGRSLAALLAGEGRSSEAPPELYAETLLPQQFLGWAPLKAVRDDRWKLIDAPRPELYDLRRDPGERQNLYAEQAQVVGAMRGRLAQLGAEPKAPASPSSGGSLDAEAAERLAALGYVGAGNTPGAGGTQSGADPKDVIGLFNRLHKANVAVRDRRFADALPVLAEVLKEQPDNPVALMTLANAHFAMGHFADAALAYHRHAELVPNNALSHYWIAVCALRLNELNLARDETEAALILDPKLADARALRGAMLSAAGQYDEAVRELRAAVEADPRKPAVHVSLARAYAASNHPLEAQAEYEAALSLTPEDPGSLIGLGVLMAGRGDLQKAEELLRKALAAQPADATARFDLAAVLEKQGRRAEAAAEYRRLSEDGSAPPQVRQASRRRLQWGGK